jgi:hypothetical protein
VSIVRPLLTLSMPARPDLDLPSGGGGADLVPGADPARQDLGPGTASAVVTFNAPTGGTGAGVTSGVTLSKPVGSPASLGGTGLGPYTVSNMRDGEAYVLIYTATDIGDGQVANNFALVDVGGLGAGSATQVYAAQNSRQVIRYKAVTTFPVYSVET